MEWIGTWWKQSTNLSYMIDNNFSSSCIGKSQHKNSHISLSTWNHSDWFELVYSKNIVFAENFNGWYNHVQAHHKHKLLQIIDTSLAFSHLFVQRERQAMKDKWTHYGAMDKSLSEQIYDRNLISCIMALSSHH